MTGRPARGFRQLWLNQSAADFEDSVAGQLVLESPKSSRRFGFGYAEGTAADFEDSIGGTMTGALERARLEMALSSALFRGFRGVPHGFFHVLPLRGLPDFLRHDDDASAKWQPSLRPKGEADLASVEAQELSAGSSARAFGCFEPPKQAVYDPYGPKSSMCSVVRGKKARS